MPSTPKTTLNGDFTFAPSLGSAKKTRAFVASTTS